MVRRGAVLRACFVKAKGAVSGAKITGQRGGFVAAPAGQKKGKAPFGLGENQETRGTAAKEIVREVCALWFFGPKEKGSCSRAESFCFFQRKGAAPGKAKMAQGRRSQLRGICSFFKGGGAAASV